MNFLRRFLLNLIAWSLRLGRSRQPQCHTAEPRILVIRRNRLGDMVCALPLLHTLREHYPKAHLTVACDPPGRAVAQACAAVDDVLVLEPGWNRYIAILKKCRTSAKL